MHPFKATGIATQDCIDKLQCHTNLVTWTLSGAYDDSKPVLIDATDSRRFVTLKRARNLVSLLAGQFKENSTVCLHLANDITYPILTLAILASSSRWTGTNPAYTAPELRHHLQTSEADYIITASEHLDVAQQAVNQSGRAVEIIIFTDILSDPAPADLALASLDTERLANSNGATLRTLRDLVQHKQPRCVANLTQGICPDSTAVLMSTSGTSGFPKIAARSHRALMVEQEAIQDNDHAKPYDVRRLFSVPCFHAFAAPEMLFNALRLGHTSYFMKRFDSSFAQKIYDYEITETFGPPPMLSMLVNEPKSYPLLQSLRYIAFGGAPLVPELRRRVLNMFQNPPRVVPVYGMTEGGWFTTLKYPDQDNTGSLGRAIPGYELKLDPEVNGGQAGAGEVLVRGPQLMTGYLNNASATVEAFAEGGWLRTGDIGYIEEGKVYLIDRAKDLIKCNGWQVAPVELENALLQHPDIIDAAAFGVGQDVDEHPMLCAVTASDELTEEAVKAHLRSRLTGYKVSKSEIRFVKSIPKSGAGKILKKVLKSQMLGIV
ncbi:AMP-dependent synthetase and ligase [Teratosphaeria nubilosa]|uniref:AMP-dependent synthetase and ligase n=1 Tax=Teratosphaeria nubilosa TaxID=161662 RepID=A0A6G1LNI6_9PEZI|nr:AMP-dependent synthetase and ligase [Teratosphaeria nubilosa]